MKKIQGVVGMALLIVSIGARAEGEPVVSPQNIGGLAAGAGILWGSETLFSGARGGRAPAIHHDLEVLRHWAVPRELLDKEIARLKAEAVRTAESRRASEILGQSAAANKNPKLSTNVAGRWMKEHLLSTSDSVSNRASIQAAKEQKKLGKLLTEIERLNKVDGTFNHARYGSSLKTRARVLARLGGLATGLVLVGTESGHMIMKWNREFQELREPTLEELEELQATQAKSAKVAKRKTLNRSPAVLSGKEGPVEARLDRVGEETPSVHHGSR